MALYDTFRRYLAAETPVAIATVVAAPSGVGAKMLVLDDGRTEGEIHPPALMSAVVSDALRRIQDGAADTVEFELEDEQFSVFIDPYPAPSILVIVGATGTAVPLSTMARMLGYRVVVADARGAFAQADRFPDAHEVLKGWPQDVLPQLRWNSATYVVLLSHDPKFDGPTLDVVLPTDVRYIGAIGSRKTQHERFQRLRDQGYSEAQLSRIHGPVGLNIGAQSAEEMALAILAEITAVRRNRTGGFLRTVNHSA